MDNYAKGLAISESVVLPFKKSLQPLLLPPSDHDAAAAAACCCCCLLLLLNAAAAAAWRQVSQPRSKQGARSLPGSCPQELGIRCCDVVAELTTLEDGRSSALLLSRKNN